MGRLENSRVVPRNSVPIDRNVVPPLRLVDPDLASISQVMEVLVAVHACLLRRRPARSVNTRRPPATPILFLPIHQQRNGILGARIAPQSRGDARRRTGRDFGRAEVGHHTLADVDVVRVEVVADVRVLAGPCLERLELVLGLRHVRVEVVEVAELGQGFVARVRVGRVEALVVLDVDEDAGFAGFVEQVLVLAEELHRGLGDHYVDLALNGVQGDRVVSGVGCEDGDGVAGGEGVDGCLVGVCIALVVGGERVEGGVEVVVGLGDVLLEVLAWGVVSRVVRKLQNT